MRVGPDGLIYVYNYDRNEITRHDPTTGASVGVFVTAATLAPGRCYGFAFGSTGDLYAASSFSCFPNCSLNRLLRIDGRTGALRSTILSSTTETFDSIMAGPDGSLVVTSDRRWIRRINPNTGATLTTYQLADPLAYWVPAMHPDGDLLFFQNNSDPDFYQKCDYLTGVVRSSRWLTTRPGRIADVQIGATGHLLIAGATWNGSGYDSMVREYDARTGRWLRDVVSVNFDTQTILAIALSQPEGATRFGIGTTRQSNTPCLTATESPRVGNFRFEVHSLNSPLQTAGTFLLGTTPRRNEIFVGGFNLWIDTAFPNISLPVMSDIFGLGSQPLPIPPQPLLAGIQLHGQFVWLEASGTSATTGVAIRILP